MGIILDMAQHKARKLDCQGEATGDFNAESRSMFARQMSRLVRMIQADHGDGYAAECLSNELLRVKYGRK